MKNITKLLTISFLITAGIADVANAAIPRLNYTCPGNISVHADQGGPIYINGKEAKLKVVNNNYYTATGSGVTVELMINADGTHSMSYTGAHGANGICQDAD